MRLSLLLSKIFFLLSVLSAILLQGTILILILIEAFPKKAKDIKSLLKNIVFTFALAGVFADPVVSRTTVSKPTSRRGAKFNYEIGFDLLQFNFNLTSIFDAVRKLTGNLHTIKKNVPLLSTDAENRAVKSLLLDCEVKINSTSKSLDKIRNFFEEGSEHEKRSAEFLGEIWHEVSGSPGPLEYHKEVEAIHRIETSFHHVQAITSDQQKEIKLIGSTLDDEQKEIDKSGKALEHITNHFLKFAGSENSLDTVIDFNAKCNVLTYQMGDKLQDIKHAIEMGTEGRASIDLIPMDEFRKHIREIKHNEKILSPIFNPAEAQLYYTLPLVRMLWENNVIRFYIRVPLVDFSKRYEISPINKATSNKLSNYDYILTSSDGKYFRFLSDAELKNCIKTKGQFISDLRVVQSSLRMLDCNQLGCTGKNDNGPFEITQLTTTTFAYSSNIDQNATLLCKKHRKRVYLPREGFITIPATCSLMSNLFDIDFFPQDVAFEKITGKTAFTVSELHADFNTSEGKWHLGLQKLKLDVHSNMAKLDVVEGNYENHMKELSQDLTALHADAKFLQSQVYGGLGVAGFLVIAFMIGGVCLCCFLKKRFATFVKV